MIAANSSCGLAATPGRFSTVTGTFHASLTFCNRLISFSKVNFRKLSRATRINHDPRNLLTSLQFGGSPIESRADFSGVVNPYGPLGGRRNGNRLLSMDTTKQTRSKGRKRTAKSQKASASAHDRKHAAGHRKASASDAPDIRTWAEQVELPPPTAPEPKTVLQSKVDTLIGLLGETPPVASTAMPTHAAPALSPQSASPTTDAFYKEMLWCISSLEVAMAALPSRRQGADEDSPLEPMRFGPISESDRQAVANSIALLKTQPPEPTAPPVEALEAAQLLRAVATRRWNTASIGQADTFLPAAKSARSPLWLAKHIGAAADAAIHWINSLTPPF
jgi:hypothetical protein